VSGQAADRTDPGFGVYVHWPFCLRKCPYCDFNSHVREAVDHGRWRDGLLRETDAWAALTPGRTVTSVFFGGGTPSLMEPATVGAVLDRIAARWAVAPDVEVTLEANPTSAEAGRFAGYRAAGVNRVSLGVQSLRDDALRFLGREHSAAEALAAVDLAARHFGRVSFDLIYARPGQTVAAWEDELREALARGPGHLSVYQLTIEEGTRFHALHARGELVVPDEDAAGDLYEATQAMLGAAGLPAYEISNHARPGEESRHNLVYWRYGDYAGIGPGAHGRWTDDAGVKRAVRTHRAPEVWLERALGHGHAMHPAETVDADARRAEFLMMGLRLAEGVQLSRFPAEAGGELRDAVDAAALDRLVAGGFLEVGAGRLRATPEGRQRLDAVVSALLG
jgi:oxygen-independent coproporphyrinogen-3 oxidase